MVLKKSQCVGVGFVVWCVSVVVVAAAGDLFLVVCRLHMALCCLRDPEAAYSAQIGGRSWAEDETERFVGYVIARAAALLRHGCGLIAVFDGKAGASKAATRAAREAYVT